MGTADAAGALVQHGDDDVLDAQIVQAYGRSGDVHDGIHRADFVKVHGFQRSTMGLCLGLAQNGKDAHGRGAGAVGQIGFVQDVQHLGQPAVCVVMVVLMHIVGVAALLHPAVQVGRIVVVVLVLGVQHHVKIAGVQPGLFHSADVDAEPIQRQALRNTASSAPRSSSAAVTISPLMPE